MRRAAESSLVLVAGMSMLAVVQAADRQAPRTLKDLPQRQIEIRRDPPADSSAARAMENYRAFLDLQRTDPALRAEALRRLGDLSLESGELERMEAEVMQVDLGGAEAIRLYTLLLQAHPDHPRNDQVLYQLARAYETTGQAGEALATLDQIVSRFPASRDIAEVHFRRGELLFSAQRYREAELAYGEVTRRGEGSFYQQGLYKQGWSLFKQNLNEESLPVFARLLDVKLRDGSSPRGFRAPEDLGRADREIVEDTLRVMSLTFSYHDDLGPLHLFVDQQGNPAYAPLLYSHLGDLFVEKERYQDGAAAYRAFVAREPRNEYSPLLSTRAIEAYSRGGFAQLVLEGKREYVENYNLGTGFWQGRQRAAYPQVVTELKAHLTDLAAYHHAEAQRSRSAEDFAQAARWYRLQLQSFPDDADSAQVNYRLADVLYEGGQFAQAVDEYERSAYAYPFGPDSARAGYAALSAYQQQEALLPDGSRAAWRLRAIESGVRFAQTFPQHPDGAVVLTRGAEDLYRAGQLQRAIEVAGMLLARDPPATLPQRRIGFSVVGQASFDQLDYSAAERAWTQARELAVGDEAQQVSLSEQLSVAVYRQAEARRAGGDTSGAIEDFLRVSRVAPGTPVVEAAQYDAAAELIKLSEWSRAIGVLEAFRRDYPASRQQDDVTQKLAVAYMQAGRADAAAAEFLRVADARDQPEVVRLEALNLAAEQFEQSGNDARTVQVLERLVAEFPAPIAERIETRQRLADFAARSGNRDRLAHWQRDIVTADGSAGGERTDRTRYLAARASLALAEPVRDNFRALALSAPLGRSLTPKRNALESALAAYRSALAYDVAEVTTRASFEIAELYRQLAADLLASERPRNLSADELEQYDLLLEEQALPFEEDAIELHAANAARARDGLYDDAVKASYSALAELLPARFGKTELPGMYADSLMLPVTPEEPAGHQLADAHPGSADPVESPGAQVPAVAQPPPRLASQFLEAVELARSGQGIDAELEFRQLLEAAPFAGAAHNLGVLLREQGRLDDAAAALQEAVVRAPRSAQSLNELGYVHRLRGDFDAAADAYQRALSLDGELAAAHRNLGVLLDLYLDDPGAALHHFERYQALTGEERPVTSWLADVRQRAARRAPEAR